jgi:hypothetical protein
MLWQLSMKKKRGNFTSIFNMTVKELKKALRGVPDDAQVVALIEHHDDVTDIWFASYEKEDEEGNYVNQVVFNC